MTSPPQAVRREIAARGLAKALPAWMRSLGGETGGRITTRGACRSKKICTCWYAPKMDRFLILVLAGVPGFRRYWPEGSTGTMRSPVQCSHFPSIVQVLAPQNFIPCLRPPWNFAQVFASVAQRTALSHMVHAAAGSVPTQPNHEPRDLREPLPGSHGHACWAPTPVKFCIRTASLHSPMGGGSPRLTAFLFVFHFFPFFPGSTVRVVLALPMARHGARTAQTETAASGHREQVVRRAD